MTSDVKIIIFFFFFFQFKMPIFLTIKIISIFTSKKNGKNQSPVFQYFLTKVLLHFSTRRRRKGMDWKSKKNQSRLLPSLVKKIFYYFLSSSIEKYPKIQINTLYWKFKKLQKLLLNGLTLASFRTFSLLSFLRWWSQQTAKKHQAFPHHVDLARLRFQD